MLKHIRERIPSTRFVRWSAALLAVIIVEIFLTVVIPEWRNLFYNVLETKAQSEFVSSLALFGLLMGGMGLVQGLKVWVGQKLSFLVREAQTKYLFRKWVHGDRQAPHYTQAMTEAVRNSTEIYLEILVEIVISLAIVVALLLANLHNPLILITAVGYTAVVSLLAILFNKPLINKDMSWQRAEGLFRENLTNIANGTHDYSYSEKWAHVSKTYSAYITTLMHYTLFTRFKGNLSSIVPYLILSAPYFAGTLTLGGFMAGVATFELIVLNATIVMMLYPKLTKARASKTIIKEFTDKI